MTELKTYFRVLLTLKNLTHTSVCQKQRKPILATPSALCLKQLTIDVPTSVKVLTG